MPEILIAEIRIEECAGMNGPRIPVSDGVDGGAGH